MVNTVSFLFQQVSQFTFLYISKELGQSLYIGGGGGGGGVKVSGLLSPSTLLLLLSHSCIPYSKMCRPQHEFALGIAYVSSLNLVMGVLIWNLLVRHA